MAISRDKKQTLVAELVELLSDAKATAFAQYEGLSVADLQALRAALLGSMYIHPPRWPTINNPAPKTFMVLYHPS